MLVFFMKKFPKQKKRKKKVQLCSQKIEKLVKIIHQKTTWVSKHPDNLEWKNWKIGKLENLYYNFLIELKKSF